MSNITTADRSALSKTLGAAKAAEICTAYIHSSDESSARAALDAIKKFISKKDDYTIVCVKTS